MHGKPIKMGPTSNLTGTATLLTTFLSFVVLFVFSDTNLLLYFGRPLAHPVTLLVSFNKSLAPLASTSLASLSVACASQRLALNGPSRQVVN